MPRDHFQFRKKNQLKKSDKSIKESWDDKIINLCEKINSSKNFYTTSSCSGRILLIKSSDKKLDNLFIKVWHDKISFEDLKSELEKISYKKLVYFKQDPCILHVSTDTLENAQTLHDLAKTAGWKRSGIIASKKRFVVELNATGKLEFPIINNGKILVEDEFLKILVDEANKKLEDSWKCIDKLEKSFKSN